MAAQNSVAEIGVKLTADTTQFDQRVSAAKTKLEALGGTTKAGGTRTGKGGGTTQAGGGTTQAGPGTQTVTGEIKFTKAQVGAALKTATEGLSVRVPVSITKASIRAAKADILAGIGAIPVTISPKFAEKGPQSITNIMGSVLSMQYDISQTQGRALFKETVQKVGPMPKGMAAGGAAKAFEPIVVGERRPEVFVPNTHGRILPSVDAYRREMDSISAMERQMGARMRGIEEMLTTIPGAMSGRLVRPFKPVQPLPERPFDRYAAKTASAHVERMRAMSIDRVERDAKNDLMRPQLKESLGGIRDERDSLERMRQERQIEQEKQRRLADVNAGWDKEHAKPLILRDPGQMASLYDNPDRLPRRRVSKYRTQGLPNVIQFPKDFQPKEDPWGIEKPSNLGDEASFYEKIGWKGFSRQAMGGPVHAMAGRLVQPFDTTPVPLSRLPVTGGSRFQGRPNPRALLRSGYFDALKPFARPAPENTWWGNEAKPSLKMSSAQMAHAGLPHIRRMQGQFDTTGTLTELTRSNLKDLVTGNIHGDLAELMESGAWKDGYFGYEETREFIKGWATSATGEEMMPFHERAAEIMGNERAFQRLAQARYNTSRLEPIVGGGPEEVKRIRRNTRAMFGSMYKRTQADLKSMGIDRVRLYRGMGDFHDQPMNPLASWTAVPFMAQDFGTAMHSAWVPRQRILATPRTGIGAFHETEYVVMHSPEDRLSKFGPGTSRPGSKYWEMANDAGTWERAVEDANKSPKIRRQIFGDAWDKSPWPGGSPGTFTPGGSPGTYTPTPIGTLHSPGDGTIIDEDGNVLDESDLDEVLVNMVLGKMGGGPVHAMAGARVPAVPRGYQSFIEQWTRNVGGAGRVTPTPAELEAIQTGTRNYRAFLNLGQAFPSEGTPYRKWYQTEAVNIQHAAAALNKRLGAAGLSARIDDRSFAEAVALFSSSQRWEGTNVRLAGDNIFSILTGGPRQQGFVTGTDYKAMQAILGGQSADLGIKRSAFNRSFWDPNATPPVDRWVARTMTLQTPRNIAALAKNDPERARAILGDLAARKEWRYGEHDPQTGYAPMTGEVAGNPLRRAADWVHEQMAKEYGYEMREVQAEPWGWVRQLKDEGAVRNKEMAKQYGWTFNRQAGYYGPDFGRLGIVNTAFGPRNPLNRSITGQNLTDSLLEDAPRKGMGGLIGRLQQAADAKTVAGMRIPGPVGAELNALAEAKFGFTNDPVKAGWINPEGRYLDMSGGYNSRTMAHRMAGRWLLGTPSESNELAYEGMMERGWNRIAQFDATFAGFQTMRGFTPEQLARIGDDAHKLMTLAGAVDFTDFAGGIESMKGARPPGIEEMLQGINKVIRGGSNPQPQSMLAERLRARGYAKGGPVFGDDPWDRLSGGPPSPTLTDVLNRKASARAKAPSPYRFGRCPSCGGDHDYLAHIKGRAAGGSTPKGLYIVGEIGEEMFVPKHMEDAIPDEVMTQIPKAAGGAQVIGKRRNELWAAPDDGWIIPNRLMDKVDHIPHMQDAGPVRRFPGSFTEGPIGWVDSKGNVHAMPGGSMGYKSNQIMGRESSFDPALLTQGKPSPMNITSGVAPEVGLMGRGLKGNAADYFGGSPMTGAAGMDNLLEITIDPKTAEIISGITDVDLPYGTASAPSAGRPLSEPLGQGREQATRGYSPGDNPLIGARGASGPLGSRMGLTSGMGGADVRFPFAPGLSAQAPTPRGMFPVAPRTGLQGGNLGGVMPMPLQMPNAGTFNEMSEFRFGKAEVRIDEARIDGGGGGRRLAEDGAPYGGGQRDQQGGNYLGRSLAGPPAMRAPGGLTGGRAEYYRNLEMQLMQAGQATTTRTPRGQVAVLASTFFGGGRTKQMQAVAEQRAAAREMQAAEEALPRYITESGAFDEYREALDNLSLATGKNHAIALKEVERLERANPELKDWADANDKYQEAVKKGLPGLKDGIVGLGKVAVGIQAYSMLAQGMQVGMQALSPAVRSGIDGLRGWRAMSESATEALSQQMKQQNGNTTAVMNQYAASLRLGEAMADLTADYLEMPTAIKSGARTAKEMEDNIKALLGVADGAPAGTYGGFGGVGETGFLAGVMGGGAGGMEALAGAVDKMLAPASSAGRYTQGQRMRFEVMERSGASLAPEELASLAEEGKYYVRDVEMMWAFTKDLSTAAQRGAQRFFDDTEVIWVKNEELAKTVAASNLPDEFKKFADAGLVALVNGQAVLTRGASADTAAQATVAGMSILPPETWAREVSRQLDAQWQGADQIAARQRDVSLPYDVWKQIMQQPMLRPGLGVSMVGASPEARRQAQANLTRTSQYQTSISEFADAGPMRTSVLESFGQGSEELGIFDAAQDAITRLSADIADFNTQMLEAQETAQDAQFANQFRLARRSLGDALGMLGEVGGTRLGYLQREQWLAQRASQSLGLAAQRISLVSQELSIALQKRQIATALALARFQAPGETGEERYARQREAIIRAGIQQEQVGLQEQQVGISRQQFGIAQRQFAIAGRIWSENARRAALDAEKSLQVMQVSRDAQLTAAAAQKGAARASQRMGGWLQQAANIAARAEQKHADSINATAQGVVVLGATFVAVDNLLKARFFGQGQTTKEPAAASGWVGTTSGETSLTVGEAGAETVAVLRNPRRGMLSGGGGGTNNISISINNPSVRNDGDISALADMVASAVERRLSDKGEMLGLRQPSY